MNHDHSHTGGHGDSDTTGVHGMLLFGEEAIYLSHLPMFATPHNFQVLLEVAFEDAVRELLRSKGRGARDGIWTFAPDPFPIVELAPPAAEPARTSIEGTVFQGHFERGGEPIAEGAVADIRRVVYFTELDVAARRPGDRELTYLCFGHPGRLHLAHEVTARPDFDHVLAATLVPDSVRNQAGRPLPEDVATIGFDLATRVVFRDRADAPESRLAPGERTRGFFSQTVSLTGAHGFTVEIEVEREIYLEVDELS